MAMTSGNFAQGATIMPVQSSSPKRLFNNELEVHGFRSAWPLALILSVVVLFTAWIYVRHVPVGQPPDEWAHLSYIADISSGTSSLPNYAHSTILSNGQQNYLNHPPLYYSVMGLCGRLLHWDAAKSYRRYRSLSVLMVAAGIFLWSLTLLQWGLGALRTVGLILSVLAVPMFPYLAASINNDNLCYLGVAAFFYGTSILSTNARRGAFFCAFGLIVTFLTKATGSLFLVVFMVMMALMSGRSTTPFLKRRPILIAAIATITICSVYYLPTLFIYHTLFPAPGILYQGFIAPEHALSFFQFVETFASHMLKGLPIILAGAESSSPLSARLNPLFYAMLISPLIAWMTYRPFSPSSVFRHISDAFFLALLVTLAAHFWVCWHGYQKHGLVIGMQPRYYSYALPGIFFFAFLDNFASRPKTILFFFFCLCASIVAVNIPPRASVEHYIQYRASQVSKLSMPTGTAHPSTSLPVSTTEKPVGSIDGVRVVGDQAFISGWAVDATDRTPTRALWVSVHGQLLGTVQPSAMRQDVADALGSVDAAMSGFMIVINGANTDLSPCDISIAAEQDNGSLVPLSNTVCH